MRKYIYRELTLSPCINASPRSVPWGAIASAVGSLGSAAIGAASASGANSMNYTMMQETNKANAELAKQQNDWNEQMYLKYDSPLAKKTQLQEAGYNPLFSDASSSDAGLQSANLANQQAYQQDPNVPVSASKNISDAMGNFISNLAQQAQVEKLRADISKSRQEQRFAEELHPYEVELADTNSRLQHYNLNDKEYDYSDPNNVPDDIKKTPAYQNILSRRDKAQEEVQILKQSYNFAKQLNPKQLSKLDQDIRNSRYSADIAETQALLAKKYGISPNDDGLLGLIKIGLRDETAYSKIISSLFKALSTTIKDGISALNPF